jgi:hypothetical protein
MIHRAKELSTQQKLAVESLLGRSVGEEETISLRVVDDARPPEWLESAWESARRAGVEGLSMEEIDAEIAAVRKARREGSVAIAQ